MMEASLVAPQGAQRTNKQVLAALPLHPLHGMGDEPHTQFAAAQFRPLSLDLYPDVESALNSGNAAHRPAAAVCVGRRACRDSAGTVPPETSGPERLPPAAAGA